MQAVQKYSHVLSNCSSLFSLSSENVITAWISHALHFVGFELYIQKCMWVCACMWAHARKCVSAFFFSVVFLGNSSLLLDAVVVFYFSLLYNFYYITYDNLFIHSINETAFEIIIFVVYSLFYPHPLPTSVFKFEKDKGFIALLTPQN